jgi:hypothetical protein
MPFFGVPIRNGLPIGLGSVAGFGVQQFDPSLLFEGGTVPGAWYDPSDLSTMFTTDAGTTPVAMPGGGTAVSVGRILDKSGGGNHAIAINNTTARPELRARVNLLTYSEEFNVAPWTNLNGVSVTANQTTAPNGTLTADTITENTASSTHFIRTEAQLAVASTAYIYSLYVKNNNANYITLSARGASSNYIAATFTLTGSGAVTSTSAAGAGYAVSAGGTTITDVGNGWFRCVLSGTMGTNVSSQSFFIALSDGVSAYDGNGIMSYLGTSRSAFIWGADLRPANIGANVPAYQRIADANTYDTAGFPLYLRFDGIDDSMYTPANLNLSGTDKVAVFAGVRKNADVSIVAELSANASSNNGAFLLATGGWSTENGTYVRSSRGTATSFAQPATNSYPSPQTNVLTGTSDIAGDSVVLRINGAQVATSATDQGSGNYGTYPLYIGARNNSSLWFNGHLYSLAVVGSTVSAGNIAAMESWVAGKTGIAI